MLMFLRVRINNKSFTQFLWILHHFKAIYHSKDMTTNERNLMYICLQRPKLTSVVSCWDTFHVRSRATVPRGKGNAWTAINVFRATILRVTRQTHLDYKWKHLQENSAVAGNCSKQRRRPFSGRKGLEFGCQEVEICIIFSHMVTLLLYRKVARALM